MKLFPSSLLTRSECLRVGIPGIGRCCAPRGMAHFTPVLPWSTIDCKVVTPSLNRIWTLRACVIDCTARHTLMCMMTSHSECLPQSVCLYLEHLNSSTFHLERLVTRCGPRSRDSRWEELPAEQMVIVCTINFNINQSHIFPTNCMKIANVSLIIKRLL
jgi:hypothetical protein